MTDRPQPRGARRAAAKDLWRKTRRQARNQEDTSFTTMWSWVNDDAAEARFAQDQRRVRRGH